ncbi:hypothetical protein [Parvularcula sp. LCG005]|uniref:hypothetical protein n=1 Tax=Parvularcula sp. LCG005 TaxID=3078805 RepID=UPI002942C86A|nr:hypothetical protein [Parvularcula sp. LCG005]WOI52950.1 hypothetical protein RUI03_12410 [Parvularcula sp. LCG005]
MVVENRYLREGRLQEALEISESRVELVDKLESVIAVAPAKLPAAIRPQAERLIALNQENAALLQGAIAGQNVAKMAKAGKDGAAGYGPDGSKIFAVSEKNAVRF